MIRTMLAGIGLLLAASATTADAQTVAGTWTAEYPTRHRIAGGGVSESDVLGTAILTLEVKGDSVFGTWAPQNTPAPVPPRKVKGTYANGQLHMVSDPTQATVRRSGVGGAEDESSITMVTYYEGTVKDGAIDGMMHAESTDNTIRSSPTKWTARLAK